MECGPLAAGIGKISGPAPSGAPGAGGGGGKIALRVLAVACERDRRGGRKADITTWANREGAPT